MSSFTSMSVLIGGDVSSQAPSLHVCTTCTYLVMSFVRGRHSLNIPSVHSGRSAHYCVVRPASRLLLSKLIAPPARIESSAGMTLRPRGRGGPLRDKSGSPEGSPRRGRSQQVWDGPQHGSTGPRSDRQNREPQNAADPSPTPTRSPTRRDGHEDEHASTIPPSLPSSTRVRPSPTLAELLQSEVKHPPSSQGDDPRRSAPAGSTAPSASAAAPAPPDARPSPPVSDVAAWPPLPASHAERAGAGAFIREPPQICRYLDHW